MIFYNAPESRLRRSGLSRLLAGVFIALMLALHPALLLAKESTSTDTWEFMAAVYGWMPAIDVTGVRGYSADIDFSTIMDNLNFTFMGSLGAQKGKWFLATDAVYMDLSDTGTTTARFGPAAGAAFVNAEVDLKAWIVTPMAGYRVVDQEKIAMDVLVGARYLYIKASVDANPFGLPLSINRSDSGDNWAGIIGIRGDINLTEEWHFPYYLDIGTGDSTSTWQAWGGVGYRVKSFDIVAGYRYLDYDLDNNRVIGDLTVGGPMVGLKYFF